MLRSCLMVVIPLPFKTFADLVEGEISFSSKKSKTEALSKDSLKLLPNDLSRQTLNQRWLRTYLYEVIARSIGGVNDDERNKYAPRSKGLARFLATPSASVSTSVITLPAPMAELPSVR